MKTIVIYYIIIASLGGYIGWMLYQNIQLLLTRLPL